MRFVTSFALVGISGLLIACSRGDESHYSSEKDEVQTESYGKGRVLKSGQIQEMSFRFTEPMSKVFGKIKNTKIAFHPIDSSSTTWAASIAVPSYSSLGDSKEMRVFAYDLGGTSVVDSTGPLPGAWFRRDENGNFPEIPDEYESIRVVIEDHG